MYFQADYTLSQALLLQALFHFSINNEILNGVLHLLIATEHRTHHIVISALKDKWNYTLRQVLFMADYCRGVG